MKTILNLEFKESLSESSIQLIKRVLLESLGFETKVLDSYEIEGDK